MKVLNDGVEWKLYGVNVNGLTNGNAFDERRHWGAGWKQMSELKWRRPRVPNYMKWMRTQVECEWFKRMERVPHEQWDGLMNFTSRSVSELKSILVQADMNWRWVKNDARREAFILFISHSFAETKANWEWNWRRNEADWREGWHVNQFILFSLQLKEVNEWMMNGRTDEWGTEINRSLFTSIKGSEMSDDWRPY